MAKTLATLLAERAGENFELHDKHLNGQMVRVLKTIGYDRVYTKAKPLPVRQGRQPIPRPVERLRRVRPGP